MIPRIYILDREPKIEDMIEANIRVAISPTEREFIYMDGNLHGYPECCVKTFAKLPELYTKNPRKLLKVGLVQILQKFTKRMKESYGKIIFDVENVAQPEEPVYSFFSEEFFPHSLFFRGHCKDSIEKGKEVYAAITSVIPKRIANYYFYSNLMMLPNLLLGESGYSQVEFVKVFRHPLSSTLKLLQ